MKRLLPIIILLTFLTACYDGQRREMLALLDEADSLNRAYAQLPSDTLLLEAADFFDRHGSRNEQVRAHYLLGCAYRDQGQAPEALQAWQNAIDRADTTARDSISLHQLMAVYGQMADLYQTQNLPLDEIKAMKEYGHYAIIAKDTFAYIRNLELLVKPYDLLGDTANMESTLHETCLMYEKKGLHQNAVRTYSTIIYLNIVRHNFDEAYQMMDTFENESGLFDENGNIHPGYETYYYFKGLYYSHKDSLEQAEDYFRRLLCAGKNVNAYRGLLEVYRKKQLSDSVAHFSSLFENAVDTLNNRKRMETIHQMSSLYNYQRFQKQAEVRLREAMQLKYFIIILILVSSIAIAGFSVLYLNTKKKKEIAQNKYYMNRRLLVKTKAEVEILKTHETEFHDIISEKISLIESLSDQIAQFRKMESGRFSPVASSFKDSDVYHYFHSLANAGRKPSDEDWEELLSLFKLQLPNFYSFLQSNQHNLNDVELKNCMLTRIHIAPGAIANMLGVTRAYISKIRRKMVKQIFNVEGNSKSFNGLIEDIC